MLLMTSLDSCSCQTHECQCLLTCQHLTSTMSRDASDAKYAYESNHNIRHDSWDSPGAPARRLATLQPADWTTSTSASCLRSQDHRNSLGVVEAG